MYKHLLLILLLWAGWLQAQDDPHMHREALLNQGLAAHLPDAQQLTLTTAEGHAFMALFLPAERPEARGQVVLLHGDGQHADWPQGIAVLRQRLSYWGWDTLSLQLPITGSTADALAQQQNRVQARLAAALDWLPEQDERVLVLQGSAIYWLQPWLADGGWPVDAPLILLHAEVPQPDLPAQLNGLLQQMPERPLLDIYDRRSPVQQRWAEARRSAYRRAGNQQAVQLALPRDQSASARIADQWLAQRVEGWLRSLGF